MSAALPILFRDQALVAVDKPAGLAVHRGWAGERDVAMMRVRDQLDMHVFPVHRLDRATSGVLLFAFSSEIASRLCESFTAHAVEKTYLALVRGIPPEAGIIDHPLPPGEDRHAARVSAQTEYLRREVFGRYSLIEAHPRTGRLHQVRRHLKHIACPLIGDVNYGKGEHNRFFRERYGLHRLFLHATRLCLPHPLTGGRLDIACPLPRELAAVIERLRDHASQTAATMRSMVTRLNIAVLCLALSILGGCGGGSPRAIGSCNGSTTITQTYPVPPPAAVQRSVTLGLQDGQVYEIAVFQAERQTYGSSYKLTMTGFNTAPSQCSHL